MGQVGVRAARGTGAGSRIRGRLFSLAVCAHTSLLWRLYVLRCLQSLKMKQSTSFTIAHSHIMCVTHCVYFALHLWQ